MSECYYCHLNLGDSHPGCSRAGCSNPTHGRGPEGKELPSYCETHRDGGGA